ncbi:MAG: ribosome hibernation-promoting factor, HPF/YfiA family [Planctomycetota bacterium]|jgi:ribosomal subunit interface protein
MRLNIIGRHVNVTSRMEEHAREKFSKLDRYFAGIQHADVVLQVDGHGQAQIFGVEAAVVLGTGTRLVGKAQAPDVLAAIDLAESKLGKQIRRFHARLKAHRDRRRISHKENQQPVLEEATYEEIVREMLEEEEE